ncbi:MAG: diaminopimelate epimerase [Bradymonadales bacterium]|nr:MAG: diaminopimelate epimerase [Bradymonadales bacterium]
MEMQYQKLQGCQNDFIYLDFAFSGLEPPAEMAWAKLARSLSDRKGPYGADGLILLLPPEANSEADFQMKIFNADGSEAEMCGNGLRAAAKMAHDLTHGAKRELKIETRAGLRACEIIEILNPQRCVVRANMGRPSFLPHKIPVLFDDVMVVDEEFVIQDQHFKMTCVSMGNPHAVIEVADLANFDVPRFGVQIESHEAFPEGTNVEFIEVKGLEVHQRTWERGSGETKACGTGACAVGVSLIMRNRMDSPVQIQLQGGRLQVDWDGLKEVYLTGEAEWVDRGKFNLEELLQRPELPRP